MKIGLACQYVFRSQPTRSVVHSNSLSDLLQETGMPTGVAPASIGSPADPFKPAQLGNWAYLATLEVGQRSIFLQVGGRLIARWGTGAEKFQNYCTDVTDFSSDVEKQDFTKGYEDFVAKLGAEYQKRDEHLRIDPTLPAYARKALRLSQFDDGFLASKSRELLQGVGDCHDCPELASSLCSLFIAEAQRAPATFVISLMLLDLVQTGTTYGQAGQKKYTWQSMLMHDTNNIPGRDSGQKAFGKHPMAGAGTAALARELFFNGKPNSARDRVVSILSVWLAHYLTKKYGGDK